MVPGRAERRLAFIEESFLVVRIFTRREDLNYRAGEWREEVRSTCPQRIRAAPRERLAGERPYLERSPAWLPSACRLHWGRVEVRRAGTAAPLPQAAAVA